MTKQELLQAARNNQRQAFELYEKYNRLVEKGRRILSFGIERKANEHAADAANYYQQAKLS